jgi:hypothetical protein
VVTYNGPNQTIPAAQNCSKLVLAFPPVIHALQASTLDISHDENTVFGPVGITKYWSGAVKVATPFPDIFAGFLQSFFAIIDKFLSGLGLGDITLAELIPGLPTAAGQPVGFLRLFNASDIATTYSWGAYRGDQTLAQAKALLEQVLSKLNKDPTNKSAKSVPVTEGDVKDFREWDYFPHFDKAQLDQGYYDKFNALQGHMNTYYASGLNGFETVEFAIRAGIDVVNSYF